MVRLGSRAEGRFSLAEGGSGAPRVNVTSPLALTLKPVVGCPKKSKAKGTGCGADQRLAGSEPPSTCCQPPLCTAPVMGPVRTALG